MRRLLAVLAVASLTACGGDSGGPDIETRVAGIKVFKATGSLQCSGGGLSLAALQAQLGAANVQVRSAECGTDGQPMPAVWKGLPGRPNDSYIAAVQSPDFPPCFSSTRTFVMTMPRSAALHMS